ncbi:retroviral-like aspartic protease family protein [Rhodoferax sp. U2-2l]|uniref:retropepsin-like aspartic protease family protein n=1 Tax=Rhodoferax sp. U2-2l TaxID=2884000 RepID=UPI001D0B1B09|nr:retropepsin-like aspartic protease [Rhodoferax sp. U2-2l]MCB8747522.1 retroviral-like aspartic protease family protein [Rhodoferax sp. U2-2l]
MHPLLRTLPAVASAMLLCTVALPSAAQNVALAGLLGSKALLVIDGGQPRSLAPGESHEGVKLLSLQGDQATVEMAGERMLLRLGGTPVSVGGSGDAAGGNKLVLNADARGHFMTQGQINGRSASMMVDTGASMVSLSAEQARQLGLNYTQGRPQAMSTANGVIPAWRIKLDQLRVGSVTLYNMDAVVSEGAMPYVLLGNNFLSRFQMNRNNDQMVLDKRF